MLLYCLNIAKFTFEFFGQIDLLFKLTQNLKKSYNTIVFIDSKINKPLIAAARFYKFIPFIYHHNFQFNRTKLLTTGWRKKYEI